MTRPARALPEPLVVNMVQAAALLNKSVSQVKRYIEKGKLPVSRKLDTVMIPMSAINEMVKPDSIKGKAK